MERRAVAQNPTDEGEPPASNDVSGGGPTVGGDLDEATLVARAREGDPAAFEALVRTHQQRIFGLALRMMRNRTEAEDITQEVFLTAWRRLPALREDDAFAGWLYRSATRRCLNALTRTRWAGRRPVPATAFLRG